MDNSIITELDEQRIDELLTYTTGYSERNAENIRKLFMQKTAKKRSFSKRILLAAAIAAATIALSGVALAVSGVIDFGTIFNSVFNNKEAAPYIQSGDGIIMHSNDGEVSIDPIAAFFEPARSGMYVQLRLTDTTGKRLSDQLLIIDMDSSNIGRMINTGSVAVQFVDENTIEAGLLITPVDIGETTVRFDTIVSGIMRFDEAQNTMFNIEEHIGIDNPIVVPGAEFVEITEIIVDSGKLIIAHRPSDVSVYGWGSATLGLMKPDGEIIWSNSGAVGVGVRGEQDFYEIGNTDPNDLILVWRGMRADNTFTGNWEFTVTGENVINPIILNGVFEGNDIEVILSATTVEIKIFADYLNNDFPYDYHAEDALTLVLKDGTTAPTRVDGIMCDDTMASFGYGMTFIDPADVVSVTFYGTTITG